MSATTSVSDLNRDLARQINAEARSNPRSPYANKFVGIANGQIVVVTDDLDDLARQIRQAEPDPSKTLLRGGEPATTIRSTKSGFDVMRAWTGLRNGSPSVQVVLTLQGGQPMVATCSPILERARWRPILSCCSTRTIACIAAATRLCHHAGRCLRGLFSGVPACRAASRPWPSRKTYGRSEAFPRCPRDSMASPASDFSIASITGISEIRGFSASSYDGSLVPWHVALITIAAS